MEKIKCIVTNQGIELLNKCQGSGTALEFTSVKAGSGSYDVSEDLRSKTALKEYKQTFDNFYVSREAEQVVIRSTLSNDTLTENYNVREIGIWAKEKDTENEILYALSVTHDDEMGDLMFTKEDNYSTSLEYNHYLKISNDINVYVVIDNDNSLARMYAEFDKLKKRHQEDVKDLREGLTSLEKIPGLEADVASLNQKTDTTNTSVENLRAEMEAFKKSLINNMDKNIFVENFETLDDVEIINGIYNEAAMKIYV